MELKYNLIRQRSRHKTRKEVKRRRRGVRERETGSFHINAQLEDYVDRRADSPYVLYYITIYEYDI